MNLWVRMLIWTNNVFTARIHNPPMLLLSDSMPSQTAINCITPHFHNVWRKYTNSWISKESKVYRNIDIHVNRVNDREEMRGWKFDDFFVGLCKFFGSSFHPTAEDFELETNIVDRCLFVQMRLDLAGKSRVAENSEEREIRVDFIRCDFDWLAAKKGGNRFEKPLSALLARMADVDLELRECRICLVDPWNSRRDDVRNNLVARDNTPANNELEVTAKDFLRYRV